MTDENPPKPTSRPADTRQRLLDAARAEFGLNGIDGATTRAIAERAGCNEVTLFRHFESKLKLLAAVVQETSREFLALTDCAHLQCGDIATDLACLAEVCFKSMEQSQDMARAIIGEGQRRPTLANELIGDVMAPLHQRIAAYLREQQQAGQVRSDLDTIAFAEILTASLFRGMLRFTSGLSALDRSTWIHRTVEFLIQGVRPHAAPQGPATQGTAH